jgi:Domain of unknown function (DUF4189)
LKRLAIVFAAAVIALLGVAGAQPAFAQYGSIAFDNHSGRWGVSWNQRSPRRADGVALGECGTPGCSVRVRTGPGMCGALATTANGRGWGWATRRRREWARRQAMDECLHYNYGACYLRAWNCNGG